VLSTVEDLLNWGNSLTSGGGLAPSLWLQRLEMVPSPLRDFAIFYGPGLSIKDGKVGHNGTVFGFESACYRYGGYIVAALTNCLQNLEDASHAGDAVTDSLMKALTGTVPNPNPSAQDLESGLAGDAYLPVPTVARIVSSRKESWADRSQDRNAGLPPMLWPQSQVHRLSAVLTEGNELVFRIRTDGVYGVVGRVSFCEFDLDGVGALFGDYAGNGPIAEGNWWIADVDAPASILRSTESLRAGQPYDACFVVRDNGAHDLDPAAGIVSVEVLIAGSRAALVLPGIVGGLLLNGSAGGI
jgi:hypothetical protein